MNHPDDPIPPEHWHISARAVAIVSFAFGLPMCIAGGYGILHGYFTVLTSLDQLPTDNTGALPNHIWFLIAGVPLMAISLAAWNYHKAQMISSPGPQRPRKPDY